MFGWLSEPAPWPRARSVRAVRILCECGGKNLDRYVAVELRVPGAIHLSHSARADGCKYLVRAEFGAGSHFFKPACQFSTTVMGVEEASDSMAY